MSDVWYRVSRYRFGKSEWIEPVLVEKSTDCFVHIVGGRRRARVSESETYFRTFAMAREHLIAKYTQDIEFRRNQLAQSERYLAECVALTEPQADEVQLAKEQTP